jgi:hypothetical protein
VRRITGARTVFPLWLPRSEGARRGARTFSKSFPAERSTALTPARQAGAAFFAGQRRAVCWRPVRSGLGKSAFTCNVCHALNPAEGQFGTSTNASFEELPQIFKVPHLRNMRTKIGMFGTPAVALFGGLNTGNLGPQIRGFGFLNDGLIDAMFDHAVKFNPTSNSGSLQTNPDATRRDVEYSRSPAIWRRSLADHALNQDNAATAGNRLSRGVPPGSPYPRRIRSAASPTRSASRHDIMR